MDVLTGEPSGPGGSALLAALQRPMPNHSADPLISPRLPEQQVWLDG